jgi:hypothetical protein
MAGGTAQKKAQNSARFAAHATSNAIDSVV